MTTARPVHVTASAVLSAAPAAVGLVNVGVAAAAQTLKLHNCTTIGAAAAGNLIGTFDLAATNSWFLEGYFDVGVVAIISGGTPDLTITVGG